MLGMTKQRELVSNASCSTQLTSKSMLLIRERAKAKVMQFTATPNVTDTLTVSH